MTRNENQLTSLPFYTAEKYQDRAKWWVQSVYKLLSPNDRFIPFQICKSITGPPSGDCPVVPETLQYIGDFSTSVDGWYLEDPLGLGATLDFIGGSLRVIMPPGNFGDLVTIKRKFNVDSYTYVSSDIEANLGSGGGVILYSWTALSCSEFDGNLGPAIGSNLNISEACTNPTENDTLAFSFVRNVTGAGSITINLKDIEVNGVPSNAIVTEEVYRLDSTPPGDDGWVIITNNGNSVLSDGASGYDITWNGDTRTDIRRTGSIDVTGARKFIVATGVSANNPLLFEIALECLDVNGNPFNRSTGIVNHELGTGGDFSATLDVSNVASIEAIRVNYRDNGQQDVLLSFLSVSKEFICEPTPDTVWTDAKIIDADTGAEVADVTTYMNDNTVFQTYEEEEYQIAIYTGNVALGTPITNGHKYLRLSDGTDTFYSEVFQPCGDASRFIKIEWWRDTDLVYQGGRVAYNGTGFINTMYLDADIAKPTYQYEIEETARDGYKFREKTVSFKQFAFDAILPESIIDVLARLTNHEYVVIDYNGITYRSTSIEMDEPEWEEHGDLAVVPFRFETDTVITSGTQISAVVNELFANDSEAINIRGNNKRIYQLGDIQSLTDLYLAADKSSLNEAVRIPIDALLNSNVNGGFLQKSTGVTYGCEISINLADNTLFDVAAGQAVFVDTYTNPDSPAVEIVDIAAQSGISVPDIATRLTTWVYLDSDGNILQRADSLNTEEVREFAELGVLVHTDLATLNAVDSIVNWTQDADLKINDLSVATGTRRTISGNEITPNGSNLKIDRSAGKTYGLGINYAINKKDPNFLQTSGETALTFLTARGGSQIGVSSDVDTANYDPLGAGTLVPMPADSVTTHGVFFSADTGITVVHYGQYLYDSLKEAVDSWAKEKYNVIPELAGVPLVGVLAFVAGATDLSDPMQAKFITPSPNGLSNNNTVPEYSRYASPDRAMAALTYRRPDIQLREDAGTIYAEVERLGGGDLIFVFGEREYILDCTTGPGTGGKARVALTPGSATVPLTNWVYATPTTGNGHAVLNASTSYPTGEITFLLDCALPDVSSFLTENSFAPRRWTDAKEFEGRSAIARTNEWIRRQPASWESGVLQTVTIDTVPSPDSVVFSNTAGLVWQKHRQNFPALSIDTSGIYIANHPTTPFVKITDLNDPLALVTSDGTSMTDTRFNWVVWADISKSTGECKLYLNLPTKTYSLDQSAVDDPDNSAVVTVPEFARGKAFLIARMPFRHRSQSGGTYENLADSILGTQVVDLRGLVANVAGGASAPSLVTVFEDALFRIFNNANGFEFGFNAASLTANRLYNAPDSNGTLALLELLQTFTAKQNFESGLAVDTAQTGLSDNGVNFGLSTAQIYQLVSTQLDFKLNGLRKLRLESTGLDFANNNRAKMLNDSTGATTAVFLPRGDNERGTGIGSAGPSILSLIAGGVEAARIEAGVQKFNGQAVGGDSIEPFASSITFDFNDGNSQQVTLTADVTSWAITNELSAGSYVIYFVQDAVGGHAIADPTGIDHEGDNSISDFATTANDINIVNIFVMPDGTTIWSLVETITI
jgi:hypothetical protein